MEDYVGNVCPYCKSEIKENDEVIVCGSCEMPHHKNCWNTKLGCSTCGSNQIGKVVGSGKSSPTPPVHSNPTPSDTVFCANCGQMNKASDAFCAGCGTPIVKNVIPPTQPVYTPPPPVTNPPPVNYAPPAGSAPPPGGPGGPGYYGGPGGPGGPNYGAVPPQYNPGNDLEAAYIQTNIGYFKQRFARMRQTGSKSSWNWAAFFLGPFWMIYRKMYGLGFGLLGIYAAISLISIIVSSTNMMFMGIGSALISLAALGISITVGILGNSFYKKRIETLVGMGQTMVEPQRAEHIRKNGGTNAAAGVLTAVGYYIVISIITSIFMASLMVGIFNSNPYGDLCAYPGCYNDAEYGSDYCYLHNGTDSTYDYCAYPGCYNYAEEGSDYCYLHGATDSDTTAFCAYPGCTNDAVYGSYCADHVCLYGDCTNAREPGSDYCYLHGETDSDTTAYCAFPGCTNEALYGEYCYDHVCIYGDCTNPRYGDTYYCYEHQGYTAYCAYPGCTNDAEYGSYCYDHVCLYGDCTNPREEGSDYCYLHGG